MTPITEKRVVVATFFLPYTVDFELQEKKKRAFASTKTNVPKPSSPATNTEDNHLVTNLIQSLAKHQQKEEVSEKEALFDFTRGPSRPLNFFGYLTSKTMDQLEKALTYKSFNHTFVVSIFYLRI